MNVLGSGTALCFWVKRAHDVSGGAGRLRSCVTMVSDENIVFSGQTLGFQQAQTGTLALCNAFDVDTDAKDRKLKTKETINVALPKYFNLHAILMYVC